MLQETPSLWVDINCIVYNQCVACNSRLDTCINFHKVLYFVKLSDGQRETRRAETERETDGQTERQKESQTDRETGCDRDSQTLRRSETQTGSHSETDRQRYKH